jgi:hypothetical protein
MTTTKTVKTVKIWALAAGCGLAALPSWAGSIPIANFGSPDNSGNFTTIYAPGTFGESDAWTVTSGSIDLINNYWTSPNAYKTVDLDGNNPGSIATTIDVPQAGIVTIDFDLAGNPDGAPTVKTMQVQLGSATPEQFTFNKTGYSESNMGWTPESAVFDITTPGEFTLSFASEDVGSPYGAAVGAISASENTVPDGEYSLLLLSLSGGGLICLRRRLAPAKTS